MYFKSDLRLEYETIYEINVSECHSMILFTEFLESKISYILYVEKLCIICIYLVVQKSNTSRNRNYHGGVYNDFDHGAHKLSV